MDPAANTSISFDYIDRQQSFVLTVEMYIITLCQISYWKIPVLRVTLTFPLSNDRMPMLSKLEDAKTNKRSVVVGVWNNDEVAETKLSLPLKFRRRCRHFRDTPQPIYRGDGRRKLTLSTRSLISILQVLFSQMTRKFIITPRRDVRIDRLNIHLAPTTKKASVIA